jgi:ribonuclease P protein component
MSGSERHRRATFPKDSRLRKRWEFNNVQTRGHRVHTSHFVMLVLPGQSQRKRLGITVSKKVSPNAVVRNRIKRVVREVFRLHGDVFPDADVVLIAKQGAGELDLRGALAELRPVTGAMQRAARRATQEERPRPRTPRNIGGKKRDGTQAS